MRRIIILMYMFFLAFIPMTVSGQEGISHWFQPLTGKQGTAVSGRFEYSPRERVKDQVTGLEESRWEASILIPLVQGPDREWTAVSRLGLRDIHTRAVLPNTGDEMPAELWDLHFGAVYRRRLSGNWIIGGNLSLSSPSDRPFNGWYETAVMLNGYLNIPAAGRDSWVFFLNYSTNREFLPHVPIPGAGYLHAPSRDFSALVGIPLLFVNYSPAKGLQLRGFYFPIHSVFAGCEYQLSPLIGIFASFRWENDRYYRAGREDRDDRLFWYEQRAEGGISLHPAGDIEVTLSGGYAFDRFFFEGESYNDDRTDNRVDVGDGPVLSVRAVSRF
ncbi:MAG: hypothetical protein V1789_03260 [PVC group bacterium]